MMLELAILLLASVTKGQLEEWRDARATFYGHEHWLWSIHDGSCNYGYICPGEGTGWDVAALPDTHREFKGACGRCYEVKCHGVVFMDVYSNKLDRTSVCSDPEASLVVRVVDACPCNDAKSQYSNQRWCCADMDHLDLSIWAFEKLADPKWGVIGLQYRPVPCDHTPEKQAVVSEKGPYPGMPIPEGLTCPQELQPVVLEWSGVVYSDGIQPMWEFANWAAQVFEIPDVGIKAGKAVCGTLFPGGAISFLGTPEIFDRTVSLEFWVKGAQANVLPVVDVNLAGDQGQCSAIAVSDLTPSGRWEDYIRYNIYLNLFGQAAPVTVTAFASSFRGCGGMDVKAIRRISFQNNQANEQSLCVDGVELLG